MRDWQAVEYRRRQHAGRNASEYVCEREIIVVAERDEKPERRGKLPQCTAECLGCFNCFPGMAGARQTANALTTALNRPVLWKFCGAKDARAWLLANHGASGTEFLNSLTGK